MTKPGTQKPLLHFGYRLVTPSENSHTHYQKQPRSEVKERMYAYSPIPEQPKDSDVPVVNSLPPKIHIKGAPPPLRGGPRPPPHVKHTHLPHQIPPPPPPPNQGYQHQFQGTPG